MSSKGVRNVGRSVPHKRTGCSTCRQRKVKCDEAKPWCIKCRRLRLFCEWAEHANIPQCDTLDLIPMERIPAALGTPPPVDVDKLTSDCWQGTLEYWNQRSIPILCVHDDRDNPLRTLWYPVAMTETSAFYALLAQTATHRSQMLASTEERHRALHFESKALETLYQHRSFNQSRGMQMKDASPTHPDALIGVLTTVLMLVGARYLDRFQTSGAGSFDQHVRGFWTILSHSGIDLQQLDSIPTDSDLYNIVRMGFYFTVCALLEGIDLGQELPWNLCEESLARSGPQPDYNAGYCAKYVATLAEIVSLENKSTTMATAERQCMTALARNLASPRVVCLDESSAQTEPENETERHHKSVERAFRISLAIRVHVSILGTSIYSSTVKALVQNVLAEFQQNQRLDAADSFSLRALFEAGKACSEAGLRDFIRLKLARTRWRGYGTANMYQRQLEHIWAGVSVFSDT